jgi:hypothetical protein
MDMATKLQRKLGFEAEECHVEKSIKWVEL